MSETDGRLAVALHNIEPATFEHCALIRDWLADLGVRRVTLLVIPAADLHPFFQRSPALAEWLRERRDAGDGIAQQGFRGGRAATGRDAVEHVRAGRRLMELAGLEPGGYHAPSLGHALGARRELITSFDWWMAPGLWRAGTRAAPRRHAARRRPPGGLRPPPGADPGPRAHAAHGGRAPPAGDLRRAGRGEQPFAPRGAAGTGPLSEAPRPHP